MLKRFLPLLLLSLTLACTSGVTGQGGDTERQEPPLDDFRASIIIVTVTPTVARERVETLGIAPTLAPSSTAEPAPTEPPRPTQTPEPRASLTELERTATPEPEASETPKPEASETPKPTGTSSPVRGVAASATPSPTRTTIPTLTPIGTRSPTATPAPATLAGVEGDLLRAHNEERATRGLPPLAPNSTLGAIARERAQTMANGSFSHQNPDGTTVFDMMNRRGYSYTDAGENIHYNYGFTAEESWRTAMSEYMQSPGHRAAILKPNFKYVGFGVVKAGDRTYYSVVFSD